MKKIINGGIYQIDLKGTNDSEFNEKHPSIILENLKEKDMFYIIPLTTYTDDKWDKLRKYYCCRVKSTNSIARIDKVQVRHVNYIENRWFSNYKILYPTSIEINKVYDKLSEYLTLSILKGKKEYKQYFDNYSLFKEQCSDFFEFYQFSNFSIFNINFTKNALIITFNMNLVKGIAFDDVKSLFREYFNFSNLTVRYDIKVNKMIITVNLIDKKSLTLKEKFDNIMISKG